jgi:hypothetical protein
MQTARRVPSVSALKAAAIRDACMMAASDDDSDCAAGQRCRDDAAIAGVGPVQHCTTSSDLCSSKSDCPDPDEACGYDSAARRWSCPPRTIVD